MHKLYCLYHLKYSPLIPPSQPHVFGRHRHSLRVNWEIYFRQANVRTSLIWAQINSHLTPRLVPIDSESITFKIFNYSGVWGMNKHCGIILIITCGYNYLDSIDTICPHYCLMSRLSVFLSLVSLHSAPVYSSNWADLDPVCWPSMVLGAEYYWFIWSVLILGRHYTHYTSRSDRVRSSEPQPTRVPPLSQTLLTWYSVTAVIGPIPPL